MINHVNNWEKANQEKNNKSVSDELERYKERVKTFEQRLNIDLSSHKKMIDSQIDDMIKEKLALKMQIDSVEQNLSNQIKEKESLLQTFTIFKNESKEKESKYQENEIDLENKIKELDHIVDKVGQSAQTVHIQHVAMHVIDDDETLILEEESQSKMSEKDVLLSVMNSSTLIDASVNVEMQRSESCDKCFNLDVELLKTQNAYNELLKRKEIVENAAQIPTATTVIPSMFKLDLDPIAPRFLRSKDEAPHAIIKCIKNIQVRLNATVCNVRIDNETEFVNHTLREFYENVSISNQTSVARTPQQNDVEAINTACYTQNRSLIRLCNNKTPYELMYDKKPDLSSLHVFGSLCYPTNDNVDLGKLNAKAYIGIFVSYAPAEKAFKIYKRRTQKIMDTIHVTFDELTTMASEHFNAPSTSIPSTQEPEQSPIISQGVEESPKTPHFHDDSHHETLHEDSTSQGSSSNVRPSHTPFELLGRWTKNHPIANMIGDPSRLVSTRKQLQTDVMRCYFDDFLTFVEPKNFKEATSEPS
ncbi:retrovirus-related pol polyprotein from transposon TNT 1-94 [Tanacetum coccineum]